MKSADTFYRDETAARQNFPDVNNRLVPAKIFSEQKNFGAAVVAADRLRVEASAVRIKIFFGASVAHREIAHGSSFAVVRHILENRQARAASRAIYERVQVAAVVRVEKFGGAFVAGRDIR